MRKSRQVTSSVSEVGFAVNAMVVAILIFVGEEYLRMRSELTFSSLQIAESYGFR